MTEPLTIKEFADIGLANSPVLLTALAEQLPAPKQLGEKRAKRLKNRLNELRAVQNVNQLQLGRPHPLTGDRAGQFSVDLDGPMRLLFDPAELPPPTLPSGGIDWQQVSSVRLLEIGDTHG